MRFFSRKSYMLLVLCKPNRATTRPHACTDTVLQKNFNRNRQHNFNHTLKNLPKGRQSKRKNLNLTEASLKI